MAWTAPSTWVSGAILTAAQLNQQVRDNMLEVARIVGKSSAVTTAFNTTGTHTTFQDVTGLTCSVTYTGSRVLRATIEIGPVESGGANNIIFRLLRGSTTVADWEYPTEALSSSYALSQSKTVTFDGPVAGATETFKVQMRGTSNTEVRNFASSTYPSRLVVQDIGPT